MKKVHWLLIDLVLVLVITLLYGLNTGLLMGCMLGILDIREKIVCKSKQVKSCEGDCEHCICGLK